MLKVFLTLESAGSARIEEIIALATQMDLAGTYIYGIPDRIRTAVVGELMLGLIFISRKTSKLINEPTCRAVCFLLQHKKRVCHRWKR